VFVEIWYNPRCSKCRIAKEAFDDAGSEYNLRYYLEQPPTADDVVRVLGLLDLEPWEICREADAKSAGIALPETRDASSRATWVELLATNPVLIQRPIVVTDDGTAYVARDAETVEAAVQHSRVPGL
jgi:arsenate reductase